MDTDHYCRSGQNRALSFCLRCPNTSTADVDQFDGNESSQSFINVPEQELQYALPEGSERENNRYFESVEVPPPSQQSIQDVKHVYIKDMDEVLILLFFPKEMSRLANWDSRDLRN